MRYVFVRTCGADTYDQLTGLSNKSPCYMNSFNSDMVVTKL